MAVGDVFELVDEQSFQGSTCINVYYYKTTVTLTGNVAEQLCDSFEANVLPVLVACQSNQLLHTKLRATNLYNQSETHTSLISEPGTQTFADSMPSFNAIGFELVQDNGVIHNGAKRYPGVPENVVGNGVVNDSGYVADLIALGLALLLELPVGLSTAFLPVIIKRILDGGSYRPPVNSGEEVYGTIVDALYNPEVTSQTSRKIGVGE